MTVFSRYRLAPPSWSGRQNHDALLVAADAVLSGLWALSGLVGVPTAPADPERDIRLKVADRRLVARDQDVVAITLSSADGECLPPWSPGAHIDLHLPSGRVRQYSLCGDPSRRNNYRVAVRRVPSGGGGSVEIHDELPLGAILTSGTPRNAFPLSVPGYGSFSRRLRFVAGGIGITPILPMLACAEDLKVDWSLIYVGRKRESLPFIDELKQFGHKAEVRTNDVDGVVSVPDLLGEGIYGSAVYACGPTPMLTAIRSGLIGHDNVEFHFERFAAPPVDNGQKFAVRIASSGRIVNIAANETLLSALRRHGVAAPYSCQQGFCGTCRINVFEGIVDHRDTLLTEPERDAGAMLTCVSRATDGQCITLDL